LLTIRSLQEPHRKACSPSWGGADHKTVDSGPAGVGGWTVPGDPPNLIQASSSGNFLEELGGCDS
jgi:hypothetical protein